MLREMRGGGCLCASYSVLFDNTVDYTCIRTLPVAWVEYIEILVHGKGYGPIYGMEENLLPDNPVGVRKASRFEFERHEHSRNMQMFECKCKTVGPPCTERTNYSSPPAMAPDDVQPRCAWRIHIDLNLPCFDAKKFKWQDSMKTGHPEIHGIELFFPCIYTFEGKQTQCHIQKLNLVIANKLWVKTASNRLFHYRYLLVILYALVLEVKLSPTRY